MTKRLHAIVFLFLLTAPLLIAQESKPSSAPPAKVAGAWQISWESRAGAQEATMQIQQEGAKLSGTFEDASGSSSVTGTVAGNNVSLTVQLQAQSMTFAFTGTVDGDKMSGTFHPQGGAGSGGRRGRGGAQSNYTWSGVRQQSN